MAWQSPSAMNGSGANGGGDGSAPAGTEYTLQGMPCSLAMLGERPPDFTGLIVVQV